jgi:hypothetical protein
LLPQAASARKLVHARLLSFRNFTLAASMPGKKFWQRNAGLRAGIVLAKGVYYIPQ